ncbi:MAG: NADPH-dependent assimilatory sulfite reductase hemoprotein subunit [Kyrpidia tusciae]|nr:NADPH-dependent assimilatory sulfite reductase hemoprotein subunit [Kyrpidia tusciae]MBE3552821.1 NADPH-dependent assimilatory sulfite reductase hemoprotein subunit [Kyrpidia tusciae]
MSNSHSPTKNETIKARSDYLRGTVASELAENTASFSDENREVLKFHGIYQQDDRDLRPQLKKQGQEPHYQMMIRARIPGGVVTPEAYLVFDELSDRYGQGSLRITTRQTFQWHGVLKGDLKNTIRSINEQLVTTLGGCGDQVRNIILCPAPLNTPFRRELENVLKSLVDALSAKTPAYHEIWLDGQRVDGGADEAGGEIHGTSQPMSAGAQVPDPVEPLYGQTYLPRKFKVALAIEGDNCVDVYTNDLGLVAHGTKEHLEGFTVLVGGGMGRTASRPDTYPRLATPLGFVTPDQIIPLARAVVSVQRDYGNRSDRKQARLKYLLDSRGLEWFRHEVEQRLGWELLPARPLHWQNTDDHLGWHDQGDGRGWLGIFIPSGRIRDAGSFRVKTALREIVSRYRPGIRLTPEQNLLLTGLDPGVRTEISKVLHQYGVPLAEELPPVQRLAMSCVALPTCGLAVAESERALPGLLEKLQQTLAEVGLADEPLSIRMTGCPNGCARPYVGDIGLVGRSPGRYDIWLGGDSVGTRLAALYETLVPYEQLVTVLRPLLVAFQHNRRPGERFGDFCTRVGLQHLREIAKTGETSPDHKVHDPAF